jgi:clathrin heavy chain
MINFMSQQASTIENLRKDNEERKARETSQQKDDANTPILGGSRLMLTQGPAAAARTASPQPYMQPNGITPQPTGFARQL